MTYVTILSLQVESTTPTGRTGTGETQYSTTVHAVLPSIGDTGSDQKAAAAQPVPPGMHFSLTSQTLAQGFLP